MAYAPKAQIAVTLAHTAACLIWDLVAASKETLKKLSNELVVWGVGWLSMVVWD